MFSAGLPAGAAGANRTMFYVLEQFYLKNGTQMGRIHEFVNKVLPLTRELAPGPSLFLEALVAPHMPQFAAIHGYHSLQEMNDARARLFQRKEWRDAMDAWESHAEPPYEHFSASLLQAAEYSPEIAPLANPPKTPRIFELRTYHSPTRRQLLALHERFAGPEIRIFHRTGVHPLLYSSMVFGNHLPNLTYVIPFDSLAAREKAWAAFGADPEWVKVRAESVEKHGQISSVMEISLFRATPYSPVK